MKKEGPLESVTSKSVAIKRDMGKYDDIIHLEHHVSKNHKPMSIYDRSAQFAPFAALVGYDESIKEAGRVVDKKITLGADKIEEISRSLAFISENIDSNPLINITYFKKDMKKTGGKYLSSTIKAIKIDTNNRKLILEGKISIDFIDIIDLSIVS